MEEADVKKECPSCGLGVALDSTVCEFCGWDFEEEDEWILQIEKLERDLMLEKQKFEPGTVNQRIESTLHTPSIERIDIIRARQERTAPESSHVEPSRAPPAARPAPAAPAPSAPTSYGGQKGLREARPSEMQIRSPPTAPPEERVQMPRPVSTRAGDEVSSGAEARAEPSPAKVRRVRTVKVPQADDGEQERPVSGSGKTRLVRRVKK